MRKKDMYLDFKAERKRLKFKSRRPKKDRTRLFAVLLVLILALLTGGGTFYFIYRMTGTQKEADISHEKSGQELIVAQQNSEAGPFGLWSVPEESDMVEVVEEEPEEIWMEDFVDTRTPIRAKGIYMTSDGVVKHLDRLIGLLDRTELNTMVIDIKDDDGRITFQMNGTKIDEFGTSRNFITDIKGTLAVLKEHNIYVIARIVALKDPLLGKQRPDLVLHNNDGSVYRDYSKLTWLNPFKQEVLDYLIEIATVCAEVGFDEVNFDYIRFPTDGKISEIDLGEEAGDKTKIDGITEAVKYLCERLKPLGVYVSADVFGGIITSAVDQRNVGQNYVELSRYLDYICPMIYPSHYANGYYGLDYPDTKPYELMFRALLDSQKVLSVIEEGSNKAKVRPWLQDFTASWLRHYIKYGPKEVRTQIDAVYDAGYDQWLLWNAAMNYTEGAMMTEEEADYDFLHRPTPSPSPTPTPRPDATPTPKPNTGQFYESPWKEGESKE